MVTGAGRWTSTTRLPTVHQVTMTHWCCPAGRSTPTCCASRPAPSPSSRTSGTPARWSQPSATPPWLLIEAGIVKGRNLTSYPSVKTDVINAGGNWHDEGVVVDQGLVTSRKPTDLESFCLKIAEEVAEGTHHRRAA